ncbi:protein rolling stone-like isoform X3 [Zootermopsis nevadensis]|uniref:protein rolling stone-like isoform X3 n=1 Tax=Zootermopsis nevadensis TaxID=136037 RepID=UPI000B8E420E|nr:protein rolling stone-like isoform X3 [Zootermopsis nevadensis]
MVTAMWKRELHLKSITLEHNKPDEFVRCQWQSSVRVHLVYLTYRWFLAILFLATMIFSICDTGGNTKNSGLQYISKWPIYLTNWGYTVCTMQAILGAWLLTRRLIAERKPGFGTNDYEISFSYKVYWALNTTGIVMAFGITVAYWLTVYDPDHFCGPSYLCSPL